MLNVINVNPDILISFEQQISFTKAALAETEEKNLLVYVWYAMVNFFCW